jgi:hypothetical protein
MLFSRLPTEKRENQKKSHQTLRVAVASAGRRFVLLPGFVLHQENQETQQKSRFSVRSSAPTGVAAKGIQTGPKCAV